MPLDTMSFGQAAYMEFPHWDINLMEIFEHLDHEMYH